MQTKIEVAIYKKDLCTGQKTNQQGNEKIENITGKN